MDINDNTAAITALDRLIESYRKKIETLTNSRDMLLTEQLVAGKPTNGINGNNSMSIAQNVSNKLNAKYPLSNAMDTVGGRILSIMKTENRFLFRTEIEEIARKLGKPFSGKISSQISALKKEGKHGVCLHAIDTVNNVWGFEDWIDKDGKIKPEHMYSGSGQYLL